VLGALHNLLMGHTPWERIDQELKRLGKNWAWLSEELGFTMQRLQNWKTRGVPPDAWLPVADALDVSLDWLAGRTKVRLSGVSEPTASYGWPFKSFTLERYMQLPPEEHIRLELYVKGSIDAWEARRERDRKRRAG
jgi:hypothetical protein